MLVRIARHTDRVLVSEMMHSLWPDCPLEEAGELFDRTLGSSAEEIMVSEEETLIGFAMLSIRHEYVEGAISSPVGYLEGIYVRKEQRRKGVAAGLVTEALSWCSEKGCSQLGSDVEIGNQSSLHFHKEIGFRETNRIVTFMKNISE